MVKDINKKMKTDLKTVGENLSEIELIREVDERHKNFRTLEANVRLMIDDLAEELKSIASTLESKDSAETAASDDLLVRASTSKVNNNRQQGPIAVSERQSEECSTDDSNTSDSAPSPNAQKKIRRRRKHSSKDSNFTNGSKSSDGSMSKEPRIDIKSEPTVHSRAIEDLMDDQSLANNTIRASSADSSKDADNDDELLGFAEGTSEIEIGIKTELLQSLESEPMILSEKQSESTTFNESPNGSISVTKECDSLPIDKSAIANGDADKNRKSSDIDDDTSSNENELLSLTENDPNAASDGDDADIRK